MRLIIAFIEVLIFFITAYVPISFADVDKPSTFQLEFGKETILVFSGISCHLTGDYLLSRMKVPDPSTLNSKNINAIDRFATKYYSKKLSYYSDNTKDATTVLLALTLTPYLKKFNRENIQAFLSDVVLFIEAESIITGLTECAKGLSERPRPFAYNSSLPIEKRRQKSSFESFWSGHASLAFTTAVFTGYVFQNHHPESHFIVPVWITGISFATATSLLRVRSGNHFPTDVIFGAAAGSFIGWVVPWIHKEKNHSLSLTTNVAGTTGICMLYYY